MEELDNKERREEIFSRAVRAGKRTYFFDVKATRSDEYYLTITESKRRFNNDQGNFFYEKHKLFLYKEDFEKFKDGLNDVISFIDAGKIPQDENSSNEEDFIPNQVDVEFEDLNSEKEQAEQYKSAQE
jgi:hypothetical protein